mgnify:CR=1 FL=1
MNQINANATTPGENIEWAHKNERLTGGIEKNLNNYLVYNASNLNDKHLNELCRMLSDKI